MIGIRVKPGERVVIEAKGRTLQGGITVSKLDRMRTKDHRVKLSRSLATFREHFEKGGRSRIQQGWRLPKETRLKCCSSSFRRYLIREESKKGKWLEERRWV